MKYPLLLAISLLGLGQHRPAGSATRLRLAPAPVVRKLARPGARPKTVRPVLAPPPRQGP